MVFWLEMAAIWFGYIGLGLAVLSQRKRAEQAEKLLRELVHVLKCASCGRARTTHVRARDGMPICVHCSGPGIDHPAVFKKQLIYTVNSMWPKCECDPRNHHEEQQVHDCKAAHGRV